MTSKKHHAYVAIWSTNGGKSFAMSRERGTLRTSSGSAALAKEDAAEEAKDLSDKPEEPGGALAGTIVRIIESSHSQTELLFLSSFFFERYTGLLFEHDVVLPIENSSELLETIDGATVYGLSEEELKRTLGRADRIRQAETGLRALPAAILMSIVATFDTNIADVVRDMLTLKADLFQTGSRTILLRL